MVRDKRRSSLTLHPGPRSEATARHASKIVLFIMSVIKYLACRAVARTARARARLRTLCFGAAAFACSHIASEGWCLFFVVALLVIGHWQLVIRHRRWLPLPATLRLSRFQRLVCGCIVENIEV